MQYTIYSPNTSLYDQQQISLHQEMFTKLFRNAIQFPKTRLTFIQGSLPQQINGHYFRNGAGNLNYGPSIINHWFASDGFLTKVKLSHEACEAQGKFAHTSIRAKREQRQSFQSSGFQNFLKNMTDKDSTNASNTSVHLLKNSDQFLSLYQGGRPLLMSKQGLKTIGFTDYNWIKAGYSAHPKIDPDSQDIYNLGMSPPSSVIISKANSKMQKICEATLKLRNFQSIHDFCLAGDYIVIFECPVNTSIMKMVLNKPQFNPFNFNKSQSTLVHIYKKSDLTHVKTLNLPSCYVFHFTNGYTENNKIKIQYSKYGSDVAEQLFDYLMNIPRYTIGYQKQYAGHASIQQLTIDLDTFEYTVKSQPINGEFPICQDHEVGKKWRYTYMVSSSHPDKLSHFDQICKFDRQTNKSIVFQEDDTYFNEPALIRCGQKLYLMSIVCRYEQHKSYVYMFDAENLKRICVMWLPEYIPPAFHGKWQSL